MGKLGGFAFARPPAPEQEGLFPSLDGRTDLGLRRGRLAACRSELLICRVVEVALLAVLEQMRAAAGFEGNQLAPGELLLDPARQLVRAVRQGAAILIVTRDRHDVRGMGSKQQGPAASYTAEAT
jgi:hypothetical protein